MICGCFLYFDGHTCGENLQTLSHDLFEIHGLLTAGTMAGVIDRLTGQKRFPDTGKRLLVLLFA